MWWKLAFVFLFLFSAQFTMSVRYSHVNEVFNSITHDYLYHAITFSEQTEEAYFNETKVTTMIDEHFTNNLKVNNYEYKITFYRNGRIKKIGERSNEFRINLKANLGFSAFYDKTFKYYVTRNR